MTSPLGSSQQVLRNRDADRLDCRRQPAATGRESSRCPMLPPGTQAAILPRRLGSDLHLPTLVGGGAFAAHAVSRTPPRCTGRGTLTRFWPSCACAATTLPTRRSAPGCAPCRTPSLPVRAADRRRAGCSGCGGARRAGRRAKARAALGVGALSLHLLWPAMGSIRRVRPMQFEVDPSGAAARAAAKVDVRAWRRG